MTPRSQSEPDKPAASAEQALAAAHDGDDAVLGELLESCRGYLVAIARAELDRGLQSKLGSSDIVQETIIKAHTSFNAFRGQTHQELLGWMRQILINILADTRRYHGAAKRDVDREDQMVRLVTPGEVPDTALAATGPTPGTATALQEQFDALTQAMLKLPADYRAVVVLRNWERLPFAEVGRRLDRSEAAAQKLWVRAIAWLKEALAR